MLRAEEGGSGKLGARRLLPSQLCKSNGAYACLCVCLRVYCFAFSLFKNQGCNNNETSSSRRLLFLCHPLAKLCMRLPFEFFSSLLVLWPLAVAGACDTLLVLVCSCVAPASVTRCPGCQTLAVVTPGRRPGRGACGGRLVPLLAIAWGVQGQNPTGRWACACISQTFVEPGGWGGGREGGALVPVHYAVDSSRGSSRR